MAIPHCIVKIFESDNHGLVTPNSAKWGEYKGLISGKTSRGISHADIVDFRRMNYSKIDIRNVYVSIVEDLKNNNLYNWRYPYVKKDQTFRTRKLLTI